MCDVIFSSRCREDESSTLDLPNPSSHIFENLEGEIYCFSCSPLFDSLDHEDASFCDIELSDDGFGNLFIDSFYHDFDFFVANISQPSICDDLPSDELELPQDVEAL